MSKSRLVFMEIVIGLESDHIRPQLKLHIELQPFRPRQMIPTQCSRACNPLETNKYPNKLADKKVSKHHLDIFCSLKLGSQPIQASFEGENTLLGMMYCGITNIRYFNGRF